ncbi:Cro/CI family transcriptional regulator [Halomonas getboli]|uniref:Cro/CI family transcriptional regulator n=1 Tax=Halomonas getboli TaxID=2935862 RepID=UPI001FFFBC3F|nr:Cro/CI family transcriptional regulator [Halomonas getboli]MCK2183536.1 Cro/CI family transcriptional regulator [Halomonas getboli]
MTKQDVLDHFGGTIAAAKALGRSKGAVSQWPDQLPANLQFEIEGRTAGALRADTSKRKPKPARAQRA